MQEDNKKGALVDFIKWIKELLADLPLYDDSYWEEIHDKIS